MHSTTLLWVHNDLHIWILEKGWSSVTLTCRQSLTSFIMIISSRCRIQDKVLDSFKSYLMDRGRSVYVSGAISAPRNLTFGFLQGSVTVPRASHITQILFLKLLNNTMSVNTFMQMTLSSTFLLLTMKQMQTEPWSKLWTASMTSRSGWHTICWSSMRKKHISYTHYIIIYQFYTHAKHKSCISVIISFQ